MPTRVSGEAVCGGACFKGQHSPRGRRTRWRGSPGRSQTLPRDWPRRCERCAVAAASTSWGAARERGANGARGGHGATPKVATAKKNTAVQFFAPRATILRISQGKRTRPQKTAVQFFFLRVQTRQKQKKWQLFPCRGGVRKLARCWGGRLRPQPPPTPRAALACMRGGRSRRVVAPQVERNAAHEGRTRVQARSARGHGRWGLWPCCSPPSQRAPAAERGGPPARGSRDGQTQPPKRHVGRATTPRRRSSDSNAQAVHHPKALRSEDDLGTRGVTPEGNTALPRKRLQMPKRRPRIHPHLLTPHYGELNGRVPRSTRMFCISWGCSCLLMVSLLLNAPKAKTVKWSAPGQHGPREEKGGQQRLGHPRLGQQRAGKKRVEEERVGQQGVGPTEAWATGTWATEALAAGSWTREGQATEGC